MAARVKRLRRLPVPRYPTWDLVRAQPSLLAREVPARWQGRSAVVAALTAATLGTTTVARQQGSPAKRPIAVVFEHGAGRGSYGCVSVAPPAFLSEEEARQVVVGELAEAGLKLVPGARTIPAIVRHRYYILRKTELPPDPSQLRIEEVGTAAPLTLDGYDAAKCVGYAFVSEARYKQMGGPDSAEIHVEGESSVGWSSVGTFEFAETARNLASRINGLAGADANEAVGVFYDPSVSAWEEMQRLGTPTSKDDRKALADLAVERAKSRSREQLREQVKDFAAWLHDQGILR